MLTVPWTAALNPTINQHVKHLSGPLSFDLHLMYYNLLFLARMDPLQARQVIAGLFWLFVACSHQRF